MILGRHAKTELAFFLLKKRGVGVGVGGHHYGPALPKVFSKTSKVNVKREIAFHQVSIT